MRKRFTYGLLAALIVCGCQEEELNLNVLEPTSFTVSIEDLYSDGATKTSLCENGDVLWKKGDQVSVFAGSTINEQYQITDNSDGKTSANLNRVSSPNFGEGSEIDNNVAYYPYSSTNAIAKDETGYKLSVVLPSTQAYAEASFANGSFPMAAITSSADDMNLKLKNVLGGLKLQLKGTASIASISISGNADEILCGAGDVSVSTADAPSITLTDASAKTITLDCGTGVQLNTTTATPFIIALPPMTMASGFTVIVKDMEGKRMEIRTEKPQTITRSSLLKMPEREYEVYFDYAKEPFTITSNGNTSISIKKHEALFPNYSIVLQYKKNDENWTTYTIGYNINLIDGEKVQFRAGTGGNDNFSTSYGPTSGAYNAYYYISSGGTGSIDASGNLMSLLDSDLLKTSVPEYGFTCLFRDCKNLVDASNLKLPATMLANGCYSYMFCGCIGLAQAPELPATMLADECYSYMFYGCIGLAQAPELPATMLADECYRCMFWDCIGLTKAPELPATMLADECYRRMFDDCTGLTQAPELPATTLADYCYSYMFSGCTSLTQAPELPAITLVDHCYTGMFAGCSSLNYVKALFIDKATSSDPTSDWLSGVSATGTFVKNSNAKWTPSNIPRWWTIITDKSSTSSMYAGTWLCSYSTDTSVYTGEVIKNYMVGEKIVIKDDGTYTSTSSDIGASGTWSASNGKITAKSSSGQVFNPKVTISSTRMIWDGTANGFRYHYVFDKQN